MRQIFVDLKQGKLVDSFVAALKKLDGRFTLISGHTVLDATSIMGIYCLNLSEPILLQIDMDSEEAMKTLEPFITV